MRHRGVATTSSPAGELFFRRAVPVASYYGFSNAVTLLERFKHKGHTPIETELRPLIGNLPAAIISGQIAGITREPLLFYNVRGTGNGSAQFTLDIVGMSRSVAEALLIKTTLTMLEEAGIRGARVHVNSVGDRDSMQRFSRELQAFLRRHIEELPAQGRELMKRDLFGAFAFLGSRHRALFDSAPKPMEFLSEASRRHLREVLEHLETADVSYEVNDDLVSCEDCYSQTLFEIHHTDARTSDDERGPLLARGGRYDELLRRLSRGPFSAVRMLLTIRAPKKKDIGTVEKIRGRKPKIYFIQLGPEARLRSLRIIEILRRAHIPLFQSLAMETLTGQLTAAESLAVPYAIIMGQKEVVENTVIVRNLSSRRQDTVPVDTLPSYIKHMGL